MRYVPFVALALLLHCAAACAAEAVLQERPPVAAMRPVTDDYFGTKVVDPYRWMENRTAPEFIHYMLAQGAYEDASSTASRSGAGSSRVSRN